MHFNKHSEVAGLHARFSASSPHWINYDEDKMTSMFMTQEAAARGTRLHKLAHDLIKERQKLPDTTQTLNMYVNDCIGFGMTPEQPLVYTENFFGTPDAISFRQEILRISDLKTGLIPAKETQLEVYAALFCLEYQVKPFEIQTELRIYQNDDVVAMEADPVVIALIMDKAIAFDRLIKRLKEEVRS